MTTSQCHNFSPLNQTVNSPMWYDRISMNFVRPIQVSIEIKIYDLMSRCLPVASFCQQKGSGEMFHSIEEPAG